MKRRDFIKSCAAVPLLSYFPLAEKEILYVRIQDCKDSYLSSKEEYIVTGPQNVLQELARKVLEEMRNQFIKYEPELVNNPDHGRVFNRRMQQALDSVKERKYLTFLCSRKSGFGPRLSEKSFKKVIQDFPFCIV